MLTSTIKVLNLEGLVSKVKKLKVMKEIIRKLDKQEIDNELTDEYFVRQTNNGNNEIYIFTYHDSPKLMQEVGRLRELTFRSAGGGTGKEVDIDNYDTSEDPYKQLIVWDPVEKEILGGYRYHICSQEDTIDKKYKKLATSKLFKFSDKFIAEYLPHMIELGRSFVQPEYQSTQKNRQALYALDNLWDGLGAVVVNNPSKKYFFGKVTIYQSYNKRARDLVFYFMEKYFADHEQLLTPVEPIQIDMDKKELDAIFTGKTYLENYRILSQQVRKLGETIPPLINAYMNLSPSMKTFGTALNPHFGNVVETGIMITIKDLYQAKVERHVMNYDPGREKRVKN